MLNLHNFNNNYWVLSSTFQTTTMFFTLLSDFGINIGNNEKRAKVFMESESKRRKQKCHPQISMPAWCLIYLKFVIVIAGENVWSLAESISKGNATSVRSPNPSSDQASIKEPIGFRKIQFSNSSFQVIPSYSGCL